MKCVSTMVYTSFLCLFPACMIDTRLCPNKIICYDNYTKRERHYLNLENRRRVWDANHFYTDHDRNYSIDCRICALQFIT